MSTLLNRSKESAVVATQVVEAKSYWSRLVGLMGRKELAKSHALWLAPCDGGIHTFFMRFAIDCIFVDENLKVRRVVRNLKPWRLVLPISQVHGVFELCAGQAERVSEGDQLYVGH